MLKYVYFLLNIWQTPKCDSISKPYEQGCIYAQVYTTNT